MRAVLLAITLLACTGDGGPGSATTDSDAGDVAPVPVPVRRLTRDELARTVRDLLGVTRDVAPELPAESPTWGFDVVATGLTVSPLHVEAWEAVVEELVDEVLSEPLPLTRAFDPATMETEGDPYWSSGPTRITMREPIFLQGDVRLPVAGRYRVGVHLVGGSEAMRSNVLLLGVVGVGVQQFDLGPAQAGDTWIEAELDVPAGVHGVTFEWTGTHEAVPDLAYVVEELRITGPVDVPARPNPAWDRVITCDPEVDPDPRGCVARVLAGIVPKAWRRPVADAELDPLLGLFDGAAELGLTPREGLGLALRAMLIGPDFVFLLEPPLPADATGPVPVDAHALAARLSYALWSSMPDDALRALADAGTLDDPAVLAGEVHRMLADARSAALVDRFAAQWLRTAALEGVQPDPSVFPEFDETLRASMREAMRRELADLLAAGRPLTALIDDTSGWVDARLADHLGVSAPTSSWARVELASVGRRGWITQPGWLTSTSAPTRTSPVRRGAFVLDSLLCDPPGTPPAGVAPLPPVAAADDLRAQLAAHRANPACATCHDAIDPLGLTLEHFDALGRWRDADGDVPIDATGRLTDGTVLDGADDLAAALLADDRFSRCATVSALTWALGRRPTPDDEPLVRSALAGLDDGGGTLEALLTAVATSPAFRTRVVAP